MVRRQAGGWKHRSGEEPRVTGVRSTRRARGGRGKEGACAAASDAVHPEGHRLPFVLQGLDEGYRSIRRGMQYLLRVEIRSACLHRHDFLGGRPVPAFVLFTDRRGIDPPGGGREAASTTPVLTTAGGSQVARQSAGRPTIPEL